MDIIDVLTLDAIIQKNTGYLLQDQHWCIVCESCPQCEHKYQTEIPKNSILRFSAETHYCLVCARSPNNIHKDETVVNKNIDVKVKVKPCTLVYVCDEPNSVKVEMCKECLFQQQEDGFHYSNVPQETDTMTQGRIEIDGDFYNVCSLCQDGYCHVERYMSIPQGEKCDCGDCHHIRPDLSVPPTDFKAEVEVWVKRSVDITIGIKSDTPSLISFYAQLLVDHIDDVEALTIYEKGIITLHKLISVTEGIDFVEEVYSMASMLVDSMELCGCRDDKMCDGCTNQMCEALYNDNQVAKGLN